MGRVSVVINDQELECDGGPVVGTYSIGSLKNLSNRGGVYSNTIKAPVSSSKNKFIAESSHLLYSQTRKPYEKHQAKIMVNGAQVLLGTAKLTGSGSFFEWLVMSGNSDFFFKIKGKKLSELNLSEFDHIYDPANVYLSRAPGNNYTYGYVYPDIDYGVYSNELSTTQLFTTFFPAIYVRILFDKIIESAGFTWSGDLSSNELFNKMILPMSTISFGEHTDEWVVLKKFKAQVATGFINDFNLTNTWYFGLDNDSTGGFFDNDNQVTLGALNLTSPLAYFESNETMDVYVEVTMSLSVVANPIAAGFKVSIGTDPTAIYDVGAATTGNYTFTIFDTKTNFVQGTQLGIKIETFGVDVTINSGSFLNEPLKKFYPLSELNIINTLPDMLQSDLLITIFNQFAVFSQTNNLTGNINFFNLNSIINNIPNSIDWTKKVDLKRKHSMSYTIEGYAQNNYMQYSKDDSDTVLLQDVGYGSGNITVPNTTLENSFDLFTSVFSATKRYKSFRGFIEIAFIPKVDDQGEIAIEAVPRIAYVEMASTDNLIQVDTQPSRATSPSVLFEDLIFENLISENYEPLSRLLQNAKSVSIDIRLNISDISTLDFSKPVIINVDNEIAYFYINQIIQFNYGDNESTEVELIMLAP